MVYFKNMEIEFSFQDVSNSNFEPILHNCPYNQFDQDLQLWLKFFYFFILSFQFFLVWLTWMKGSLLLQVFCFSQVRIT